MNVDALDVLFVTGGLIGLTGLLCALVIVLAYVLASAHWVRRRWRWWRLGRVVADEVGERRAERARRSERAASAQLHPTTTRGVRRLPCNGEAGQART